MRWGLALLLVLVGGCAYYNGMYNAKRLAGRARKAEREGRTFEATSLWGQVAIKAESAAVRHPRKKWADEARLLQGTAFVRLKDCARAMAPLEAVMFTGRDAETREQAALLVGECRIALGDPAGAATAYAGLVGSREPSRRALAFYEHGRALRLDGRYQEALDELGRTSHPRAPGERGAALAALGRVPEALAVAESLLVANDSLAPWDSLLAGVSASDPEAASQLTERIAQSPGMPAGLKARLLAQDGVRWMVEDSLRANSRLARADSLAGGSPARSEVRFEAARARIVHSSSLAGLRSAAERLGDLGVESGPFALRGAQLAAATERFLLIADSVPAGAPRGDLRLFLAGELARDSLGSPGLAASLFRRLTDDWPDSPFVPKALLALIPLEPKAADSLRSLLVDRFAGSPYLAMIEHGESPAYRELEDSLRLFALSLGRDGRRQVQPGQPNRPVPQTPPTPRQPAVN
jgi:tetratricopeptide (TPR) repeat protein